MVKQSAVLLKGLYGLGLKPKEVRFVIEYFKDHDARRAAVVSGYSADSGYAIVSRDVIHEAIALLQVHLLDDAVIDADWLLTELVDNHYIARQNNNLSASNTALNTIAKHVRVDAFAADKVVVSTDEDVKTALQKARERLQIHSKAVPEEEGGVDFF